MDTAQKWGTFEFQNTVDDSITGGCFIHTRVTNISVIGGDAGKFAGCTAESREDSSKAQRLHIHPRTKRSKPDIQGAAKEAEKGTENRRMA